MRVIITEVKKEGSNEREKKRLFCREGPCRKESHGSAHQPRAKKKESVLMRGLKERGIQELASLQEEGGLEGNWTFTLKSAVEQTLKETIWGEQCKKKRKGEEEISSHPQSSTRRRRGPNDEDSTEEGKHQHTSK